ncbi:MAG: inositol monophosphatase [Chloroflexi bacterium]|nr:inositol monophosphatase [Chloroflexota bacterium]
MTNLDFIQTLARKAGRVQREQLRRARTVEQKAFATDLVTEVDRAVDSLIVRALRERFPQHLIVSEEGDVRASDVEHVWFVDPLDGTTNYAHGYPVFAVSIGLQQRGQMVLGVVYDAMRDELFSAERGAGAFLDGTRLRVSEIASLDHALVSTGFHYDRVVNPENNFVQFARVIRRAQGVRRGGAAALDLAYVAAGRLDGHWERGLAPWDCAAAALLIEEAGGRITALDTDVWTPFTRWTLATNGRIHDELRSVLR